MKKSLTTGLVAAVIAVPALMFGSNGFATVQGTQVAPTASPAVVFSQRNASAHKRGMRRGGHKGKMFRGLGLSEQQRDQMFELRHSSKPQMRELRKRQRAAKRAIRDMVVAGQVDQSQLETLSTEIGQVSAEMVRARVAVRVEMMSVLTPEQRAKLKERLDRRNERRNK
jgi:protein CpxP